MEKNKRIKVCIVSPYNYSIPAVDGGAIEQIVESICIVNEEKQKLDITVLATYSEKNADANSKFKFSKFVYFKKSKFDKQWFLAFRLIKKLFKKYIPSYKRMIDIKKWINNNKENFDYFIFEDGLTYMLKYFFSDVDKSKVINHLHWIGDPNNFSNNYISKLLPVSNYVAKVWQEKTNCNNIPYYVVKNGIDISKYDRIITEEEKEYLLQKNGIKDNDFVVLYIGRIIPEKGVLELIEAFNKINDEDIKLILIGSACFNLKTSTNYEKKIISEVEKNSNIKMLGFIPNNELYKYHAIADIGVMPSLCEESAGLTAIECMSAGVPMIVSDSGGLVEYVDDKTCIIKRDNNFINNLSDTIKKFKNSPDLLQQKKKFAKDNAYKYTVFNMYEDFIKGIEW